MHDALGSPLIPGDRVVFTASFGRPLMEGSVTMIEEPEALVEYIYVAGDVRVERVRSGAVIRLAEPN